ncbi:hypothetical protein ACFXPN_18300 [Streptomyces griseorubiginosus]|uniref:hypothetical protein n=1 Tax=Streptomyces griseorubiginosus TaxID=67304 RepID=UPI003684F110
MDDRQNMDDRPKSLPFRRLSVAVAGAAVLVAVSVGGAIAASSDDGPGAEPSVSAHPGDESGTVGGSGGGEGGSVGGVDPDPSPTFTSPDDPTEEPTEEPSGQPSTPSELEELNRRIAELDRKVDELPTKKELADALRAFADQLDQPDTPTDPGPSHEPTSEPRPTDSMPPH